MKFEIVLLASLIAMSQAINIQDLLKGPLHASCKVEWSWPDTSCQDVQTRLLNQIALWTPEDNCKNGGEKCLYTLISQSSNQIKATHKTPVKHYVDDLTFTFTNAGAQSCQVNVSLMLI